MFDKHEKRLKRKRSKYWNADRSSKRRVGIIYHTPCICSCPMCAGIVDNSPMRYKFSDQRKLDKVKVDLDEAI